MNIESLRAQVARWEAADAAIAAGKSYTIDGLTVTRQDATMVRDRLDYWTARLAAALRRTRSSVRCRQIISIDNVPIMPGCGLWRR